MTPEKEAEWKEGYHTSSNGQQSKLSDLPTKYLNNIINKYGEEYDISAIQAEVDSRPQQDGQ